MLSLDFNKHIKCPWTEGEIKKVFKIIQKRIKLNGELEVNIVGDKEIKDLNHRFRGLNKVTDVLSFAWQEDKIIKTESLGQIYICYPQIERQAKQVGVDVVEEFTRMLTHGLLHIMGYDHVKKTDAKKMFKIQEEIVSEYVCR
jgi:probable rRNA maturation factor